MPWWGSRCLRGFLKGLCWGCAQNRVGELYSLIRFLRIFPYAFYFCGAGTAKSSKEDPCSCKCIDYPFSRNHRKCDHCG